MKRKPLFIVLIIAGAVLGIVAVVLFMKNKSTEKQPKAKFAVEPEKEETEEDPEPEITNA